MNGKPWTGEWTEVYNQPKEELMMESNFAIVEGELVQMFEHEGEVFCASLPTVQEMVE